MRLKTVLLACSLLLAAASGVPVAPTLHASPVAGVGQGDPFDGTWWLSVDPPAARPMILTMTGSGAFTLEDSIDGGGHTFSGAAFSLTQGSWTHVGGREVEALGLRFVYDQDGKTRAVERFRLTLWFFEGFERLMGTYQIEELGCAEQATPLPFTVPVCPDPNVAPTEVLRGPAGLTGTRVSVDAPLD